MIRNILLAATTMIAISNIAATVAYAEEHPKSFQIGFQAYKSTIALKCGVIDDKTYKNIATQFGHGLQDILGDDKGRHVFEVAISAGEEDATPQRCKEWFGKLDDALAYMEAAHKFASEDTDE